MIKKIAFSVALAGLFAGPVQANDSTAEKAAGGLVLTRSDTIDMVSEDLFVSATLVRVRYVFRNRTQADIRTTVAFPLPDDDLAQRDYGDVAAPRGFATTVNGKPVRMAVERKAMVEGQDHSALLASLGIRVTGDIDAQLDRLGRDARQRLVTAGLVTSEDDGQGSTGRLVPVWTIKETWHWDQIFPASRDLIVEHRYQPGAGGSVGTDLTLPGFRQSADGRAFSARYCTDATFLAGVDRLSRRAGPDKAAALPEERVSYILKTGANWRKPIASFRLVIDKGTPENLVSFCAEGVRKISPTRFEIRRTNWRPDRNLDVLIVRPRNR